MLVSPLGFEGTQFDFTGLQLESNFPQDETYFESHPYLIQKISEILDLDLKVDAEIN